MSSSDPSGLVARFTSQSEAVHRSAAQDRRSLEIVGADPAARRAHLIGQTTVAVLAATLATAIGLTIASAAQTPFGWFLTALAALVGLLAPWTWHRGRSMGPTARLPVWQLAPQWAKPVAQAAARAERLNQLADRSPPGPVADHFDRLARSAQDYVLAMHEAAVAANAATGGAHNARDPEFEADMASINEQLTDLVEAAEALRRAQRHYLECSPLAELTAQTERLTDIIKSESSDPTT